MFVRAFLCGAAVFAAMFSGGGSARTAFAQPPVRLRPDLRPAAVDFAQRELQPASIQPNLKLKDLGSQVRATVGVKVQMGFINFNTHLGTFRVTKGRRLVRTFHRHGAQIVMELQATHNQTVTLYLEVIAANQRVKKKIIRNL